jgi:hypothetical protein
MAIKDYFKVGTKLQLIERFGKTVKNPITKTVIKQQSNACVLALNETDKSGSWLYFPKSSLLSSENGILTIYDTGERELTAEEIDCINNEPKDEKQAEIDAISDGSVMYWRRKAYYDKTPFSYLFTEKNGKRISFNNGKKMLKDPAVKGQPILKYKTEV